MNLQFMVLFLVLSLILMFLNLKHWSTLKRGMRRLYFFAVRHDLRLVRSCSFGIQDPDADPIFHRPRFSVDVLTHSWLTRLPAKEGVTGCQPKYKLLTTGNSPG